jgi:hypothetical protein
MIQMVKGIKHSHKKKETVIVDEVKEDNDMTWRPCINYIIYVSILNVVLIDRFFSFGSMVLFKYIFNIYFINMFNKD